MTNRLISRGAAIEDLNLVRAHLCDQMRWGESGLRAAPPTLRHISDGRRRPGVVASGPTIPAQHDPGAAVGVLAGLSIDIPPEV